MTPELADMNLTEQDNPFSFVDEEGNFIEPIKNPFSCEGAYELARKDVKGELEANKEVGNDVSTEIQMLKWLDKLGYEYL